MSMICSALSRALVRLPRPVSGVWGPQVPSPHHKGLLLSLGNFGDRYFGTDAVPEGSDEEEMASMG